MKKNCNNISKINFENNDKNDIEKELQHKNNVIKYLESLLRKMNINPNLLSQETYNRESLKHRNDSNKRYKPNIENIEDNNIIYNYENHSPFNNINNNIKNSTYPNNPIDISNLISVSNTKIKHEVNSNLKNNEVNNSEKDANNNKNIFISNNNNINKFNNDDNNNNYNIQDNDNSSRNYFSFYNYIQNNNSSNIIEAKKINNSNKCSPKLIKKEIDDIDKEIIELQTRLKELLND